MKIKYLLWRLFAKKRKQCRSCKKTFYDLERGTKEEELLFETITYGYIGCPHCHTGNSYIQV